MSSVLVSFSISGAEVSNCRKYYLPWKRSTLQPPPPQLLSRLPQILFEKVRDANKDTFECTILLTPPRLVPLQVPLPSGVFLFFGPQRWLLRWHSSHFVTNGFGFSCCHPVLDIRWHPTEARNWGLKPTGERPPVQAGNAGEHSL